MLKRGSLALAVLIERPQAEFKSALVKHAMEGCYAGAGGKSNAGTRPLTGAASPTPFASGARAPTHQGLHETDGPGDALPLRSRIPRGREEQVPDRAPLDRCQAGLGDAPASVQEAYREAPRAGVGDRLTRPLLPGEQNRGHARTREGDGEQPCPEQGPGRFALHTQGTIHTRVSTATASNSSITSRLHKRTQPMEAGSPTDASAWVPWI